MPVNLKQIKRELQSDIPKVGKDASGEYKYTPPNIVGRRVNKYPKIQITKLKFKAVEKPEKVTITALGASESDKGTKYKVYLEFYKVKFSPIESAQFSNAIEIAKNAYVYHRNFTYGGNPIRCRCQCMDFRHRFQKPLKDADGLYGGFIGYTRKTPAWPQGRPYANSTSKLGICKHINSLLRKLESEGVLKNR